MHLNKDRREKGKTAPRAVEAINLGFASDMNTSAYKILIPSTGQVFASNQIVFDESVFPYRKEELIKKMDEGDEEIDILFKASSPITWLKYDPSVPLTKWTKVHMGSDKNLVLRSPTEDNTFLRISRDAYFENLLETSSVREKARSVTAIKDDMTRTKVKGLPDSIDPNRPPKNYRDATSREDAVEWSEAYMKEYLGFKNRGVFKVVRY